MTGYRRGPLRRSEVTAGLLEIVVLLVLLIFLGIAAGKLLLVLGRLGIPTWKGLSLGLVFLAAAFFAARRASIRARGLLRGSRYDSD